MKTVRMHGGLGNQLFCLAFARSLALASGEPVALDIRSYGTDRFGRAFMTRPLAEQLGDFPIVRTGFHGNPLVTRLADKSPFAWPGLVREPVPRPRGFDPTALVGRHGYFQGYWQDEAYILDPEPLALAVRAFVTAQASRPADAAVVIHYRTYKEEPDPRRGRVPDPDYFARALAAIEVAQGPVAEVALVSDDPVLAMTRMGDLGRPISPRLGGGWADDMALLLDARALILTNSSFSWWGGFCSRAGLVTYPAKGDLYHHARPARRFVCP